YITNLMSYKFS
uniref:Uncharacterized protein n=1 Tax=Amphimedon queenslandica TaxID=400682 RepID=A0A1X7TIK8_AMPQE